MTIHSLFKDFPLLEAWKDNLLERIKEWGALGPSLTPQERLLRKMFLSSDPFLSPWKNGKLSIEYGTWKLIIDKLDRTPFSRNQVQIINDLIQAYKKSSDDSADDKNTEIDNFPLTLIAPEEVRNIIGSGDTSDEELDKVCENSYRIAYNKLHEKYKELHGSTFEPLKLRYGHQKENCKINKFILE